ncbi:MAG: hypothetical protein COW19_03675 [Zetaproteobacteria bacterium CG12_big_fil_rev_8_21_14_0_65_55_1124]|nr:MAG: hypothetical protein AUJ58_09085 [Zetaproteobacteria bacterium CG1_02_55_237]PIS18649.1 MAG: hypothetical protein COT53_09565 [Zetaproteobacteria bacterium CG08_land_8_20_14_0_20_55_17]PIW43254.1 MAG: hypothetical protein COW19_03675 [Zetaproteobacteria bacterium CG12_big_fil_rev_8_21_14_0_65_55_1124]PIY53384.1 MAG: hypothetical protein COZ01_03910 [Zetaproteobacteria bacterium CG_4_10_14_0_8_um_filter_55_43]PIZ38713.1 MAG: hypothetical protein COY36_05585 [Zetaproteobacteria bacterium 
MQKRIVLGIVLNISLILWGCTSVWSAEFTVAVVIGDFYYVQTGAPDTRERIVSYHVRRSHFHNMDAWKVSMESDGLNMDAYLRRGDGRPIYVERFNHRTHEHVEITYGEESASYIRTSRNGTSSKTIDEGNLTDLVVLPHLLLGDVLRNRMRSLKFNSIDYESGDVYEMLAAFKELRDVRLSDDSSVKCAVFDISVNSWFSMFAPSVRLLIPMGDGLANFITYEGPSFANKQDHVSLRLLGRDIRLAANWSK